MTRAIRFILNGEERAVGDTSPTTTVLDWLRTDARLSGTKEGCAEGDCGACTVVLGEVVDGGMRYEAVNGCLALLPQLDGKLVLTVEGLEAADGALHPVQRAMADGDGTQCGFCTPGFVMALFAYHHTGEPGEDDVIHDVLAGNLCRCTGYRPIVDAARTVGGGPSDRFADMEADLVKRLKGIAPSADLSMAGQDYYAPTTLEDLAALRDVHRDAYLWAGGTDLGLLASKERQRPATVISVARVPELRRIDETGTHLEIGAAVTYTEALPLIDKRYPSMADLIRRIGSRQIRNLGTIGGNVGNASPIGDMPPCLIALDATVVLRSVRGHREIPIEEFFVDYRKSALLGDEFIEKIRIPHMNATQVFHTYKVSKRFDQDISAVIGAYRLDLRNGKVAGARIAYGGMAATPKRAATCERALTGQAWTPDTAAAGAAALAGDFTPITDFRASAAYRAKVAANLVVRLQLQTSGAGTLTEVANL